MIFISTLCFHKILGRTKAYYGRIVLIIGLLMAQTAMAQPDPPFILPNSKELGKIQSAIIFTNKGQIKFELFPDQAPWHVANFKYRADKGLYRNLVFHIFFPDYIIQAGAPLPNPATPANYTLPPEFNSHEHLFGALGMARKPDYANPDRRSSGNQFHIILGESPHMNGAFTVFGQAVQGLDVLGRLEKGDVVKDVKVFVTASPLK